MRLPAPGTNARAQPRWPQLADYADVPAHARLFGALLSTGAIGTGGLVYALGCVAMMAAMMFFMNRMNRNG